MTNGRCTNLPTECEKALSIEPQSMSSTDSRCSDCGYLLIEKREEITKNNDNIKKLIYLGLLAFLTSCLLAFLMFIFASN